MLTIFLNYMKENITMTKPKANNIVKTVNRYKLLRMYLILPLFLVMSVIIAAETAIRLYYKERISNGVFLNNTNVSGLTKDEFNNVLDNSEKGFDKLTLKINGFEYQMLLSDIGYSIDGESSWNETYKLKKNYTDTPYLLSLFLFFQRVSALKNISYNQQDLASELEKITSVYSNSPIFETISLSKDGVVVSPGKDGATIDSELLKNDVIDAIYSQKSVININLKQVSAAIPPTQKDTLVKKAYALVGKKMIIALDKDLFEIDDKTLISTLNDRLENNFENINKLVDDVATAFDRDAKNSTFIFEEGRVLEFVPSEDGILTDRNLLKSEISQKITELANSENDDATIQLPHKKTVPEITTASINNLGIKEKIGTGHSTFRGSITSRIHNIKLASSKFNGVLIAPGETLSFNKTLGDVSKVTGYQQAYIIKDGQTVLGDGGGVCQVSTTFFRAALNAGLPITERRGHSYRVSYYEQGFSPGLDATVFDPTTDLKIKNDTQNYILVQTIFNEKEYKLTFNLYGTGDGRISVVGKPIIKEVSPPPEDLYIDDPTLKNGVVKQIDYKAWGAKVYFNYKVEKDGAVLFEKIFYSNYQPWQAKFLRGTAP